MNSSFLIVSPKSQVGCSECLGCTECDPVIQMSIGALGPFNKLVTLKPSLWTYGGFCALKYLSSADIVSAFKWVVFGLLLCLRQ